MTAGQILDVPVDDIAIVMMSAIGDAVHVLPVVTALKRYAPESHITWVLQPTPASLVRGHPDVDRIVLFEKSRGLRGALDVRRALQQRPPQLLIDLQVSFKAGLVTALVPAAIKLGFDRARARDLNWLFTTERIPPHARQHVQDQYFEFLAYLGVPHEPVEWRLGPWPDELSWQRDFYAGFERPVAAMVCGTSDTDRDWLPERWAAVCDALDSDYGLQPVLVGGPSERERATATAVQRLARRSQPTDALGSGLRRLVSIIDGAVLVVSLDSAPLHMAVALDRPVISLMSQADPRRTGPYRRFQDLVVNAFAEPGDGPDVIWKRRRGRMERITVNDVLERVELWSRDYR